MKDQPYNVNLALIVHRLTTSPRGWRVDHLMQELDIKDRTYRKYRDRLRNFAPWLDANGKTKLQEVREDDAKYLRLVDSEEVRINAADFVPRLAALHLAQQTLAFVGEADVGKALRSFIHEFFARVPETRAFLADFLANVDRLFYQVPYGEKSYNKNGENISQLLRALVFRTRCVIDYTPVDGQRGERHIEPLSLVSYRGGLYLFARSIRDEELRTYAVDRIKAVNPLSEKFTYPSPDNYHPSRLTEGSFGIFQQRNTEPVDVELIFANKSWLKTDLRERSYHPSQRFIELPDGRLCMKLRLHSLVELRTWIRGFGPDVEIVSPPPESDVWQWEDAPGLAAE